MATRIVVQYEVNDLTEVGDLILPARFTVEERQDQGEAPVILAAFGLRDGAPRCHEVRIASREDGREVRSEDCRRVRVSDLLEEGVKAAAFGVLRTDDAGRPQRPDRVTSEQRVAQVRTMRKRARRIPDDDMLQEVADVYRRYVEDNPTAAVAEHFDRQHRTAALYVQQARQRGFLGAAIKGKAGER